ncbi:HipA family kinase [Arcticibacterium luteifluviistationis]|uniref:Aminotransferase class I and II n=1 Tax=Arcticibacterium luteifluviistationis TaxID=1784714 RepID=A0A2Z4GET4_9BACT|nr:HipA family kinase [Arcticibacterium luteifluviistationis]AWV99651.1 aminotransferase class I and II [Arcticibacterium luteifluviistationis]
MIEIRNVHIDRYVTPLREGGSLPAIVDADDGFMYVLKFRGAGQGCKALIADLIGGEIARAVGLKMPEMVFGDLPEGYGRTEADEEIQDLLKWSVGLNLGVHYLKGSITFDPVVNTVDALTASKIVWLDAFLMNIDRTPRNTNMLIWHKELWLIDHGASLYFHHNPDNWEEQSEKPFVQIKDHVLIKSASKLAEVNDFMLEKISPALIQEIVDIIPEDWLATDESLSKKLYSDFLTNRRKHSDVFLKHAINAR